MKVFTLLLILAALISCGKSEEDDNIVNGIEPLNPNDARELSDDENVVANRICVALDAKSFNLRQLAVGKNKRLLFNRFEKKCGESERKLERVAADLMVPLDIDETPYFRTVADIGDEPFFTSIISNDYKFLVDFCEDVIEGKKALNLILVDDAYVKYMFPEGNSVEVVTYTKDKEGDYFANRAEKFVVSLDRDDNQGFLFSRMTGSFCNRGSDETTYYKQETTLVPIR